MSFQITYQQLYPFDQVESLIVQFRYDAATKAHATYPC